jgi:hypothetical protein
MTSNILPFQRRTYDLHGPFLGAASKAEYRHEDYHFARQMKRDGELLRIKPLRPLWISFAVWAAFIAAALVIVRMLGR